MKRSEINAIIEEAERFLAANQFLLPPWGHWTLADWRAADLADSEIVPHQLGWDITDFGSRDFAAEGLVLFTLRNGALDRPGKPYAEKIMIVRERQVTFYHFHWKKTEDIINRGGGTLVIRLYGSTPQEDFSDQPVCVLIDGFPRKVPAGGEVVLTPGESICLPAGVYHSFWGEAGKGIILVGEVSVVSDDQQDNRFHKTLARFPVIEENVKPYRLLTGDYRNFLG